MKDKYIMVSLMGRASIDLLMVQYLKAYSKMVPFKVSVHSKILLQEYSS